MGCLPQHGTHLKHQGGAGAVQCWQARCVSGQLRAAGHSNGQGISGGKSEPSFLDVHQPVHLSGSGDQRLHNCAVPHSHGGQLGAGEPVLLCLRQVADQVSCSLHWRVERQQQGPLHAAHLPCSQTEVGGAAGGGVQLEQG